MPAYRIKGMRDQPYKSLVTHEIVAETEESACNIYDRSTEAEHEIHMFLEPTAEADLVIAIRYNGRTYRLGETRRMPMQVVSSGAVQMAMRKELRDAKRAIIRELADLIGPREQAVMTIDKKTLKAIRSRGRKGKGR